MKKICCKKTMEFKSVGTRVSYWDLFFQCSKCGEVAMERIDEYHDLELNIELVRKKN